MPFGKFTVRSRTSPCWLTKQPSSGPNVGLPYRGMGNGPEVAQTASTLRVSQLASAAPSPHVCADTRFRCGVGVILGNLEAVADHPAARRLLVKHGYSNVFAPKECHFGEVDDLAVRRRAEPVLLHSESFQGASR